MIEHFKDYSAYLKSSHWQKLRYAKLSCHPVCQVCSSKVNVQVHHLLYRATWKEAKLSDLMTLCQSCHKLIHKLLAEGHLTFRKDQSPRQLLHATRRYLRFHQNENYWNWTPRKRISKKRASRIAKDFLQLKNEGIIF